MFLAQKPNKVVMVRRYDETVLHWNQTSVPSLVNWLLLITLKARGSQCLICCKKRQPFCPLILPLSNAALYQFLFFDVRNFLFFAFS